MIFLSCRDTKTLKLIEMECPTEIRSGRSWKNFEGGRGAKREKKEGSGMKMRV